MSVYQFEERPASVILGRRGLFKVVGLCAVAAGATGWAVGDAREPQLRFACPSEGALRR